VALVLVVQVVVPAHVPAVFPQVHSAAVQLALAAQCVQVLLALVVQAVVLALVAQVVQVAVSVVPAPVVLAAALGVLVLVVPVVVLVVQAAVVLVQVVVAMANAVHQRRSHAHVVVKISMKCCRSQRWATPLATRQCQKASLSSNAVLLPKSLRRSSIAHLPT
jgi:predicted RND superfamily exporter protein